MKTIRNFRTTLIPVVFFTVLVCSSESLQAQVRQYANPTWAPAYYPGVRYYYIPDIETYYDLSNQDFVYLDNGQWLFSYGLPSIYSGFDLFNAYIIALDLDVFQPWMHHQFYLSNYPRYYYRGFYRGNEYANIRGFNENEHKPFYSTREERERINQIRNNATNERRPENSRPPQPANYYGRNIGQPVRVHPQMRESGGRNEGHGRR
jgi:hypothetical protein